MNEQVKYDFLVDAYEFCLADAVEQASKLQQILVKLAKIDPAETIRRWEFLIQTKGDEIWQDPTLTVDLLREFKYEMGESWLSKALTTHPLLIDFLFGKAQQIDAWVLLNIAYEFNDLEQVAFYLGLVLENPNKSQTFDEIFEEVYDHLPYQPANESLLYPFVAHLQNAELKNQILECLLGC